MTYSPYPSDGSTGWGSHYRTAVGGLDTRASTIEAQNLDPRVTALEGAATPSSTGYAYLDSFTGATDDTKLTNALAYASAQTRKPVIKLSNRAHTFGVQRTAYDCMRIEGTPGFNNPEKGSAFMGTEINLGTAGAWITSSASTLFGLYLGQLSFRGGSTSSVVGGGSTVWWCELFRDLSCSGLLSFAGTQASKHLVTACVWDGAAWDIANCYSGAVHVGGSDSTFWPQGALIDSAPAFNSAGGSAGQFHLWFDSMDKLSLGPVYITCEGNWGGIRVSGQGYNAGGTNQGLVVAHGGMKVEGRNPSQPCNGAAVRVDGGILHVSGAWIAYGMSSPTSMGHSPVDAGTVHVSGGRLVMRDCVYDRTSGQAETAPFVYVGGGQARIRDTSFGSRGGVWSGLPRVQNATGVSTAVSTDDSVTVI